MRRLQLVELEDLPGLPRLLRESMTGCLAASYALNGLPAAWAALLRRALDEAGTRRIVDLGSGGGGPWPVLEPLLQEPGAPPVHVTLTDLAPNAGAVAAVDALGRPTLRYHPAPVDAADVPAALPGLRTMTASFHHLPPPAARTVLAEAFARRCGIAVLEVFARSAAGLATALLAPLVTLLVTPRVRPVRPAQLLLTYLVPVLPLMVGWDGVVSVLRTYTPDELRALVRGLDAPDWRWEIGALDVPRVPMPLPYLLGLPRR